MQYVTIIFIRGQYSTWLKIFAIHIFGTMESDEKYRKLLVKIAANIKALREKNHLTQEAMRDYGFSVRHYQRLEGGKHSPALYTLFRLSRKFGIKMEELFK